MSKVPKTGQADARAEEAGCADDPDVAMHTTPAQVARLVQELQVHQTELETQNEELRRVQRELEAARDKYFDLYDLAPVGYLTLNARAEIEAANLTLATLLGVARTSLAGQPLMQYIVAEDQDIFYLQRQRLAETGAAQMGELRMVKAGGEPFWALIEIVVHVANAGAPPSIWTTITDISARKQAEATQRAHDARYRLLFENMDEGFALQEIITDAAGTVVDSRFLETNAAFDRHAGVKGRELIGKNLREAMPNADARQIEVFGKVATTGVPAILEYYSTTFGRYLRVRAFCPERGRFAVIFEDITDRKQAEDALRASEARYQDLYDNAPDMYLSIDPQTGRIVQCNQTAFHITGYAREELIGRPVFELYHPDSLATARQALQEFATTGEVKDAELQVLCKDGRTRDVSLNVSAVRDETGKIVQSRSSWRDITERKRQAREILRLNSTLEQRVVERTVQLEEALAELRHANQAKDEFLAAVSHELRTPLTGILGMADALEAQVGDQFDARQRRYVRTIRESGDRLLAIVNSILRYTGLIAGKVTLRPERCRLADLCAVSLHAIHPRAEAKGVALVFAIEPAELELVCDANGMIQVLHNLLDNAVKFTPPGGRAGLAVSRLEGGETVEVVVWDTGIGIAPADQARIFQPFVQADGSLARAYEGIGLGLPYVRRMVELMGGALTLDSAPGQGSRFVVTLPATTHRSGWQ